MAEVAHAWVTGATPSFGWFLIGNEGVAGSAKDIGSRENPDTTLRPRLIVTFDQSTGVGNPALPLASPLQDPSPNPARGAVRLAYATATRRQGPGPRLIVPPHP